MELKPKPPQPPTNKQNPNNLPDEMIALHHDQIKNLVKLHINLKIIWVFIFLVFTALVFALIWQHNDNKNRAAEEFKNLTIIKNDWTLKDKGIFEQKDTYRHFMLNVHRVYGVKYQRDSERSYGLRAKEISEWIDLNWELSKLLNFDPYMVPALQKMESSYDPYVPGPYNEIGIGQVKWETALLVFKIMESMDPGLVRAINKLVTIQFSQPAELNNFALGTAVQYILLWYLRNRFDYNELWYVSVYHWGGFLYRYYQGGTGQMPLRFKINDVDYNVSAYYCEYRLWVETFNEGRLEPDPVVVAKWDMENKRMLQEEIKLNTAHKRVRSWEEKYKKLELSYNETLKHYEEVKSETEKMKLEFRRIYGEAQNFEGKDIRVLLNSITNSIRSWQQKIDVRLKKSVWKTWLVAIGIGLGILLAIIILSSTVSLMIIKRIKCLKTFVLKLLN